MLRAETPQEQFNLIGAGRRNILINGAFQVWQRGTSSTSYSGNTRGYIADRWSFRYATTAEQSTDVPSGEVFKYSLKVVVASTSPDAFIIQGVEDADRFAGQTVTFSYWIKPSETCTLRDDYFRSAQGTHELDGGVWQRVTNTFVVPSDILANEFIYIQFPANKVITFYVTGVQLELGKVATPFEHRSYGEELALCQRYYEEIDDSSNHHRLNGVAWNTTNTNIPIPYLVQKRANPTVTIGSAGQIYKSGNWANATGSAVTGAGVRGCTISIQSTGLTLENGYFIRNHELTIDAEL